MPVFGKKQSEDARRRLEHKLYIVNESRDEYFDLSGCELTQLPKAVYSLSKVLQKPLLLLNDNKFRFFDCGERIRDLQHLTTLDLSCNLIEKLPDEIDHLVLLEVLDLHSNQLCELPRSIIALKKLLVLDLEANKFSSVPSQLGELVNLHELRLASNPIRELSRNLHRLRKLRVFTVPTDSLVYPSQEVLLAGTESIMKQLCEDSGVDYIPLKTGPSDSNYDWTTTSTQSQPAIALPATITVDVKEQKVSNYERQKEEKKQRTLRLEHQLHETRQAQTELAAKAAEARQNALDKVAEEEARTLADLCSLQLQREQQRSNLLSNLKDAEENADRLIRQMLSTNETAKRREALLESSESQNVEILDWQAESASLRRSEVIDSMRQMLTITNRALAEQRSQRAQIKQQAMNDEVDVTRCLAKKLASRRQDQTGLASQLALEESAQKEAFAQLQAQRDCRTQRLVRQISLIEQELRRLTLTEQARATRRMASGSRLLAERRSSLLRLLTQLIEEKQKREEELKQRLIEMEQHREQSQIDFWLVQYQHLMDKKPEILIRKENAVDDTVRAVLEKAGGLDFLSNFERSSIDLVTFQQMNDEDLQRIGVHSLGVRKRILKANIKSRQQDDIITNQHTPASAPPSIEPTAPPCEVVARLETECCICSDAACSAIFLPCGHVCCCLNCCSKVSTCPLCRAVVVQRIYLQSDVT